MAAGSALKRGRMSKLLGTRADHVRNGVANSNPEPSQVEEGYHSSRLLGVIRKDPEGMSLCRRRSPGHEPDLLRQGLRDVTTPIPGDDLDRQVQPGTQKFSYFLRITKSRKRQQSLSLIGGTCLFVLCMLPCICAIFILVKSKEK